jgi:phenylalanyl-tRNA synthetase beta chain
MNLSRLWLEAFLRRRLEVPDLVERLAMLGAPVDAVESLNPGLDRILVGLVEEVRPHPNADRLRICLVNDGTAQRRNVVCGAPNVTAGRKYPFAPLGAVLPGGVKIEKRKIRGETSEGMLCSARELGLGQEHDGILELETEAAPGTSFLSAMPVADDRLTIDVSPSRPDLLGHKGVARELAASYGVPFRLPPIPGAAAAGSPPARRADGARTVIAGVVTAIDDPEGCPRFHGAVIRGVKVGPSPAWLADRVKSVGMRSINNVVDATNYVMFELNQPMHAYDIARLRGPAVIARRARAGEKLVTLDGVERSLTPEMTVIADEGGAIGLAGVMGAAHVEVTVHTVDVYLECAAFHPGRVRRTRKTLGLSTEASHRFERGVDLWAGGDVIRRCIDIVLATAGGAVVGEPVDLWPSPTNPPRIFLRASRVAQVLGVELPWSSLEKYLVAIGATVLSKPEDGRIAVDVPGWRPDLQGEIDLIEEIARLHGYDRFPSDLRPYRPGALADAPEEAAVGRVRRGLARLGLLETQSLAFGPSDGSGSVPLVNPVSAPEGFLRQHVLPGLRRQVEANWSSHTRDIRLFETGTVFRLGTSGDRPLEALHVAGVVTGARHPAHWTTKEGGGDYDLWDLKGLFLAVVGLAIPAARCEVESARFVARLENGEVVGHAEPLTADVPAWAAPVFGFELRIDPGAEIRAQFHPIPATPPVERDLALILPAGVTAGRVERQMQMIAGRLLESVLAFDEYRGAGLSPGRRSVAFHLTFRAADRTLRDAEVDTAVAAVVTALEKELDVHLRTA